MPADRFGERVEVGGSSLSEFAGFDLDGDTARAWTRFQASLADHIAEMTDQDCLVIEVEVGDEELDGAAPYVQFAGFGQDTMVRGEVSSNGYLATSYALVAEQHDLLSRLGWREPTLAPEEPEGAGSANFFIDVPVSEADRLAVMSVKALRDVFGVAHPAFLITGDLQDDTDAAGSTTGNPSMSTVTSDLEEAAATMPESYEELCGLVDVALTSVFGQVPKKDEDGDIPVPWGSSLVFVRVEQDAPVVQLFSVVLSGVADLRRAAFEVNVLNRDLRFLKFVLVEDRVLAQMHLPAWPFVPEHLRTMLTEMSRRIDEIDEDLVARVGGRRASDAEDEPAPATTAGGQDTSGVSDETALLTLLQLDADPAGTVDPRLAASVCCHDQERLLRLLHQTEEQEVAWRGSRDQAVLDGDADEAEACEREVVAWARTTALLRRALRLVVERDLGRETIPGSTSPGSGLPTLHRAPRSRQSFPGRPRSVRVVAELDDLLRAYDVEDLVLLDEKLSEIAAADVEVFDTDDGIEVVVGEDSGELGYPFTLGDLDGLLEELCTGALREESAE